MTVRFFCATTIFGSHTTSKESKAARKKKDAAIRENHRVSFALLSVHSWPQERSCSRIHRSAIYVVLAAHDVTWAHCAIRRVIR